MRAWVRIPDSANYHLRAWQTGLINAGYKLDERFFPEPDDLLVLWNRSQRDETCARSFEAAGANVLIAENGYMGKMWNGHKWFALSVGHHNGAGWYPYLPERWDRYAIDLPDWRPNTGEIVGLPQRGIGEAGVAMPRGWKPAVPCRIRPHKGLHEDLPLEDDLKNARLVVTWGSGAAIKALSMGIPVVYALRDWIGRDASSHELAADYANPFRGDRIATFRKVLSAMWTLSEVESGEPFEVMRRENFGNDTRQRVKRIMADSGHSAWECYRG